MFLTDESYAYHHGLGTGFIDTAPQWKKDKIDQSDFIDYNNAALKKCYEAGCLAGRAAKEGYLLQLKEHFDQTAIITRIMFNPLLDTCFRGCFGPQAGLSTLKRDIEYRFGWVPQAITVEEIILLLQQQTFRRGLRLLVTYLYQNKQYEAYQKVLKSYLFIFYNRCTDQKKQQLEMAACLDLAIKLSYSS